jgi:putative transposase
MNWARILAYVTGTVDQELLARNEYLAAENRILKVQLTGRLKLSGADRKTLGEIGHRLGRKALADVATIARPDTILGWYRKLVARKFDGSKARRSPGRPRISREVEELIIRMASENRGWGYDRIAGALAKAFAMPLDHSCRLDQDHRVDDLRPNPVEPHPQEPVQG